MYLPSKFTIFKITNKKIILVIWVQIIMRETPGDRASAGKYLIDNDCSYP
jgi:hypothetical protein